MKRKITNKLELTTKIFGILCLGWFFLSMWALVIKVLGHFDVVDILHYLFVHLVIYIGALLTILNITPNDYLKLKYEKMKGGKKKK